MRVKVGVWLSVRERVGVSRVMGEGEPLQENVGKGEVENMCEGVVEGEGEGESEVRRWSMARVDSRL